MNSKPHSHKFQKGQMLSYDLIVASFILLLIIMIGLSTWNTQQTNMVDTGFVQKTQLDAMNAFESILNDSNCENGGINFNGKVTSTSVSCLTSQSYEDIQNKLGLQNYDYKLRIFDSTEDFVNFGNEGTNRAIAVQRVLVLDGIARKGTLVLYEK